jgi:hypothetical protein
MRVTIAYPRKSRSLVLQLLSYGLSLPGGTVLFGTGLGAMVYDPGEEYALMARAGMNFSEILASLTTAPVARFGAGARMGKWLRDSRRICWY